MLSALQWLQYATASSAQQNPGTPMAQKSDQTQQQPAAPNRARLAFRRPCSAKKACPRKCWSAGFEKSRPRKRPSPVDLGQKDQVRSAAAESARTAEKTKSRLRRRPPAYARSPPPASLAGSLCRHNRPLVVCCGTRPRPKKPSRRRRNPLGPLKNDLFNAILAGVEASSHHLRCAQGGHRGMGFAMWKSNAEFPTQWQQHPGDACPCRSAAVVAAVTRDPWDCSPTCDAFWRIERSGASSTARIGFGLKLERHI
jgi:hypothetical protein